MATTSPKQYSSLEAQSIKIVKRNEQTEQVGQDLHLVVANNVLSSSSSNNVLQNLANSLKSGGFILLEETNRVDINSVVNQDLVLVAKQIVPGRSYYLFKKKEQRSAPIVIQITEKNFMWLEGVKAALKKSVSENQELLFVSQGEELLGKICY